MFGGFTIPVSIALSVATSLVVLLTLIFIYMFFFSVSMVYYNHLMLDFASEEKTSFDLATYTTLTNILRLVFLSLGLVVESMGFSWAFTLLRSFLALCSALTCLALPKSITQETNNVGSYATES